MAALIGDLLFYVKAAAAALCYYVDTNAFILYCMGIALVFLMFPPPSSMGPTKVFLPLSSRRMSSLHRKQKWAHSSMHVCNFRNADCTPARILTVTHLLSASRPACDRLTFSLRCIICVELE